MDEQTIRDLTVAIERVANAQARKEVASLCGLVLNRVSKINGAIYARDLAEIFGEALSDFSGHTKGVAPGE